MIRGSAGKDLLNKLIFMGRNEDVVEIEGVKFTMSSLSEDQNRVLLEKVFNLSDSERLSQAKSIAVASSLVKINEFEMDTVIKDVDEGETPFDKKMILISKMQASVIGKLYSAFERINISVDPEEASEDLKNS